MKLQNTFIGIIPARYASTRFPAKPLALLGGHPVIEHVYKRASRVLPCLVATDDERIYDTVKAFGGEAVMTSSEHRTGTDRCAEAYRLYRSDADVVINIQGDEPFVACEQLLALMHCFDDPKIDIATPIMPFPNNADYTTIANPNTPKCIVNSDGRALYFSRHPIPYLRGEEQNLWSARHTYFRHIGVYAYRANVLQHITLLEQTPLELAESLEQLRWLENDYVIQTVQSRIATIGIDTPEDLATAAKYLDSHPELQLD